MSRSSLLLPLAWVTASALACDGVPAPPREEAGRPASAPPRPLLDPFTTVEVGQHPGALSVDAHGAANYDFPLEFAPGRARVEPRLAIRYNSSRGSGPLGVGWQLDGLSSIYRCAQSIALQGTQRPVRYDGSDPLCLDGRYLVSLGPAANQGPGVIEYRPEGDPLTRVLSRPAPGGDVDVLEVYNADGTVATYGSTDVTHAEIAAPRGGSSPPTHAWLISQLRDRHHNVMTFRYTIGPADPALTDGPATSEHLLSEIQYTAWVGPTGPEPARRTVALEYVSDGAPHYAFARGGRTSQAMVLAQIVGLVDGVVERRYRLAYATSHASGRKLLESIRRCDAAGRCLPAHRFRYQGASPAFQQNDALSWPDERFFTPIDINGDGLTDLASVRFSANGSRVRVRLSRRDPTTGAWSLSAPIERSVVVFPAPWVSSTNAPTFRLEVQDLNGDGRAELLAQYEADGPGSALDLEVFSLSPDDQSLDSYNLGEPTYRSWGDFDGDGLPDFVAAGAGVDEGHVVVRMNAGNGQFTTARRVHGLLTSEGDIRAPLRTCAARIIDLDGDGRSEIILDRPPLDPVALFEVGAPTQRLVPAAAGLLCPNPGRERLVVGDLNGDGLPDQVRAHTAAAVYVRANDGLTLRAEAAIPVAMAHEPVAIVDFDVDGRGDVVFRTQQGYTIGSAFTAIPNQSPHFGRFTTLVGTARSDEQVTTGDFDGDGMADLMFVEAFATSARIQRHQGRQVDLLEAVRSTAAEIDTAAVTYANAAQVVNNDGCTSAHSHACTKAGYRPVVTAVSYDQGVASAPRRTQHHTYGRARRDRLGRGWLGFETVTTRDPARRSTTVTTYDNSTWTHVDPSTARGVRYPFLGRVTSSVTRTAVGIAGGADQTVRDEVTYTYYRISGAVERTVLNTTRRARSIEPSATPLTMLETRVVARDQLGYPLRISEDHGDARNVEHELRYTHSTGNWIIGRIRSRTSTSWASPPYVAQVQHTRWTHDLQTGDVVREDRRAGADGLAPDRETTVLEYDRYGNVQFVHAQHAAGAADRRTDTYEYDALEHLSVVRFTNAAGHTTTIGPYTLGGAPRRIVDPNDAVTDLAYDGLDRLTKVQHPSGASDVQGYAASAGGDGGFELWRRPASGGNHTTHYTRLGQVIARGHHTVDGQPVLDVVLYDALARASGAMSMSGAYRVRTVEWDELDRLRASIDEEGARTLWVHEPGTNFATTRSLGTRTRKIMPYGEVETTHTDGQGRVRLVEDTRGGATRFDYYPNGALHRTTDAASNTTISEVDDYGRQTALVDPTSGRATYQHTGFGELRSVTGADQVRTDFSYDPLGRLRQRTNGGAIDKWTYDAWPADCGPTSAIECGRTNRSLGALVAAESDSGRLERYHYDEHGRPSRRSRLDGGEVYEFEYEYDAAGRLGTVRYPEAADGFRLEVSHRYQAGRLERLEDAATGFMYWRRNRTDAYGATLEETFGNGVTTTRAYDAVGRVRSIVTQSPRTPIDELEYDYDFNGNMLARRDRRQGMTERFTYDNLHRLTSSCFTPGVAPLPRPPQLDFVPTPPEQRGSGYHWTVPLEEPPSEPPPPPTPDSTTQAANWSLLRNGPELGAMGQSILRAGNVSWPGGETPPGAVTGHATCASYTYDAIGNILDTGSAGRLVYPAVAAGGRPLPMAAARLAAGSNNTALAYDTAGRLTQLGARSFAYDGLGRLRTTAESGAVTALEYDAAGSRATKLTDGRRTTYVGRLFQREELDRCAGSSSTYCGERSTYVYAIATDEGVVAEVRYEQTAVSIVEANVARYPWRDVQALRAVLDPDGLTRVAAQAAAKLRSLAFYHRDALGSVTALTTPADATRAVGIIERRSYTPFGRPRSPDWASGAAGIAVAPRAVGFTGHEDDVESGLVNMGGRIYLPLIGRFLTPDPFIQDPLRSQNYARLSYAWNNPLRWVDPTGLAVDDLVNALPGDVDTSPGVCESACSFEGSGPVPAPAAPAERPAAASDQESVREMLWDFGVRGLELGVRDFIIPLLPAPFMVAAQATFEIAPTALDLDANAGLLERMNPISQAAASYYMFQNGPSHEKGQHLADALSATANVVGITVAIASLVGGAAKGIAVVARRRGGGPPGGGPEGQWHAPKISVDRHGRLTNGTYTLDAEGLAPHTTGSLATGKSQFLHRVNEQQLVLDAAAYADHTNQWVGAKAKVTLLDSIGVHARTGLLTRVLNLYRNARGFVHGAPGRPQ